MKNIAVIIASLLILLISLLILIKNYENQTVGVVIDKLEIEKNEIKECCRYFANNEQKTCSVLINYSCDLCNNKCQK